MNVTQSLLFSVVIYGSLFVLFALSHLIIVFSVLQVLPFKLPITLIDIFKLLLRYTQRKKLSTPCCFEMTNDTTGITRLLKRLSKKRNGDLLGHYTGCKKPQKKTI